VGIQNEILPFSTSDNAAKSRISYSMASKLYGRLGGIYSALLHGHVR